MRVSDWDIRLFDAVQMELARPFDWNGACCVSLVAQIWTAVRGDDVFPVEITWKDEKEAYRVLRDMGFASVPDALAAHLEEVPPAMAGRGDIGTIGNACLVCVGTSFVGRSEQGLMSASVQDIQRAFRL